MAEENGTSQPANPFDQTRDSVQTTNRTLHAGHAYHAARGDWATSRANAATMLSSQVLTKAFTRAILSAPPVPAPNAGAHTSPDEGHANRTTGATMAHTGQQLPAHVGTCLLSTCDNTPSALPRTFCLLRLPVQQLSDGLCQQIALRAERLYQERARLPHGDLGILTHGAETASERPRAPV